MHFNSNAALLKTIVVLLVFCVCVTVCPAEKPNIGLIYTGKALALLETEGRDTRQAYREAIMESGGEVIVLGQTHAPSVVVEQLDSLDGVLLPGGIDVDPVFYGEAPDPLLEETDASLDQFEFRVLDHARRNHLPVLGICRGHQIINVYYGGSLIQDIPSQHKSIVTVVHRAKPNASHFVTVEADSMLHSLLQTDRIEVNSRHHQAVKRLADGFVITARSEDGIIEALEHKGAVFIVGVQFHPERMISDEPRMKALFKRFVEEANKTCNPEQE